MDSVIPPGGADIDRLLERRHPALTRGGETGLRFEGVPLGAIADAVGTPTWVVGAGTIRARFRRFRAAMASAGVATADIHYAVKANDHLAVLSLLRALGAGADVVSGGELARARRAGIPADRIVFSGVGKTGDELAHAVGCGISSINVESAEELQTLSAVATAAGRVATVLLRVNPDIAAGGHDKISTGRAGDKFGVDARAIPPLFAEAARLPGVRPAGLAVHVGSQIGDAAPFAAAFAVVADLVRTLRADGFAVDRVDAGGGLAIDYGDGAVPEADPRALADALRDGFGPLGLRVGVEPGRWLVGPAGLLLARVIRTKRTGGMPFVVLDAAMNDLARPALYGAWHGVVPVASRDWSGPRAPATVVGPVCESGDTLAPARVLPSLASDARVAILDAGAYGSVMSSTYNARPLAPIVMVDDGAWSLVRPRAEPSSLWSGEVVPSALAGPSG